MEPINISIWLPIFFVLLIVSQQRGAARVIIARLRKKRRSVAMTNELVEKYIGRNCHITTGAMGVSVTGRIVSVNENWIEVETKKGMEIMNLDYIQNIRVKG